MKALSVSWRVQMRLTLAVWLVLLLMVTQSWGRENQNDWKQVPVSVQQKFQDAHPNYCEEMKKKINFKCMDGVNINDHHIIPIEKILPPNISKSEKEAMTQKRGHVVCEHPEELWNRCIRHAYLGNKMRLKPEDKLKPNEYMIFSCRPKRTDPNQLKDPKASKEELDKIEYFDIAVIHHDEKTGATCFWQSQFWP